jgi:hypothetical protein
LDNPCGTEPFKRTLYSAKVQFSSPVRVIPDPKATTLPSDKQMSFEKALLVSFRWFRYAVSLPLTEIRWFEMISKMQNERDRRGHFYRPFRDSCSASLTGEWPERTVLGTRIARNAVHYSKSLAEVAPGLPIIT